MRLVLHVNVTGLCRCALPTLRQLLPVTMGDSDEETGGSHLKGRKRYFTKLSKLSSTSSSKDRSSNAFDVTSAEESIAQKYLAKYDMYGETAQLMCGVSQLKGKSKQKRVVVVGKYVLFTIKEEKMALSSKSKISKVFHLIDLQEVRLAHHG